MQQFCYPLFTAGDVLKESTTTNVTRRKIGQDQPAMWQALISGILCYKPKRSYGESVHDIEFSKEPLRVSGGKLFCDETWGGGELEKECASQSYKIHKAQKTVRKVLPALC